MAESGAILGLVVHFKSSLTVEASLLCVPGVTAGCKDFCCLVGQTGSLLYHRTHSGQQVLKTRGFPQLHQKVGRENRALSSILDGEN